GMTGVAAQMCGDRDVVASLGYQVKPDGTILQEETDENGKKIWKPISKLGARKAVLNDLSPAATFIAYNYNTPVDIKAFEQEAKRILAEVEDECGWMYETLHTDGKTKGKINYTVWSDVFVCPECAEEVVFWDVAVDKESHSVKEEFICSHCSAKISKRNMERQWVTKYDIALQKTVKQARQIPVMIAYTLDSHKGRFEKKPDDKDLSLIEEIERKDIPYWYPTHTIPEGEKTPETLRIGITHQHHLYQKRNLWIISCLFAKLKSKSLRLVFQSVVSTLSSKLVRYNFGNRGNGILTGTIYVPSLNAETIILKVFAGKVRDFSKALKIREHSTINNGSCSNVPLSNSSVDYIFIDPPFGANLQYSELNLFWEGWLSVFTNNTEEAIESRAQKKGSNDYRSLMAKCFNEAYRTLKPGRWMTVEFSNTKASVWNSIQTALTEAGFIVANVSALDKKQGSFNAVSNPTSVKQDLVISAYKPNGGFEERFKQEAQTEEGVWDFIRTHLKYLPVTKKLGLDLVAIP
ncbi:MAG TPA: DNA methyltransferase, partial [Caldisericia bacterium]|nr:DNA methyltransferase [Caldisericia bacterium]